MGNKGAKEYFADAEDDAENKVEVVQSNLQPAGKWLA